MPTAPRTNTAKVLAPVGTHVARVINLVDIGTIKGYQDAPTPKLRITWELPDELHSFKEGEDAKPLVVSQTYTFSMHEKSNLRPIVEGIIGTTLSDDEAYNFNFDNILDKPCLVSLKHETSKKGAKYVAVASTSPLMKGQTCKNAYNIIKYLHYENWDEQYFLSLPSFLRDDMINSPEYRKLKGITEQQTTDDIGF